ncbi:hypothetical protein B0T17DRAFT_565636 [Bombardia bombarda]|uniref:Uncharacterized protein n=1 Tax=Bombardia bombarda TaxID=252184 RepID=A0AA39WAP9_9PEZI|nr:hypothetical protein B0T17DRAFT_565636 [Bombardia bombarda]
MDNAAGYTNFTNLNHLNQSTLNFWNYTVYSNQTLSNGTWCMLAFPPYIPPAVLPNGTFINETVCWHPVYPIGARAGTGLGFGVLFGIALVLTLIVLKKHGQLFLPAERRFFPIGRRWQFYWACFTCAIALISLFTNIDVDRYYLPELPIVLTCFFWFIMEMGAMAIVWEAVRHWGSWMERQFIDPNPFVLKLDDRRAKIEFWMPLFFYFWLWMNFFLVVPRSWTNIEMQRYPQQTNDLAIPTATDGRFKAAAFCLVVCWLTISFSLWHSIKHYCPHNRGLINRTIGFLRFTPTRFILLMPLSLAMVAYQALCAWEFAWSPLNVKGLVAAIYAGGYAPALLIILIQALFGFINPNEDRELQRQRRVRGDQINQAMGIQKKPAWWHRLNGDNVANESMRDRIARNVRELGGGKATASNLEAAIAARGAEAELTRTAQQQSAAEDDVEMSSIRVSPHQTVDMLGPVVPGDFAAARAVASRYEGKSDRRRTEHQVQVAAGLLFPNSDASAAATAASRRAELMMDGPPPPPYAAAAAAAAADVNNTGGRGRGRRASVTSGMTDGSRTLMDRSVSTDTSNTLGAPPQTIRSMLDV